MPDPAIPDSIDNASQEQANLPVYFCPTHRTLDQVHAANCACAFAVSLSHAFDRHQSLVAILIADHAEKRIGCQRSPKKMTRVAQHGHNAKTIEQPNLPGLFIQRLHRIGPVSLLGAAW